MKDTEQNKEKSETLRRRAEAFLREKSSAIKGMPTRDVKALIEELQVHQVELEMQGEELRRSQLEVQDARDRYVDLYDFAPVGYVTMGENGLILDANLAATTLLGMERSMLVGMPFSGFVATEDQELFYHHKKMLLETRHREGCVLRLVKQDGRKFHAQLECIVVEPHEGKPVQVRAALMDREALWQVEQALAASEKQKSIILNSSTARIFFCDPQLKVQWANKTAGDLAGLAAADLASRYCHEIWPQRDTPCEGCPVQRAIETGQPQEGEMMTPDGTFWALNAYPAFDDKGTLLGATEVGRDITIRKRLEGQLQQALKMEAVGTLAGGIAHDFNNILAIILGNAELALDDDPEGTSTRESLGEILRASLRAKEMVRQLLAFSRKSGQEHHPLDLAPVIRESMKMLRNVIPSSVEFKERIPTASWAVLGDVAQINQIMMNLITNGAQAMQDEEGLLEVTLENLTLGQETACFGSTIAPGDYVRLRVGDTGEGIAPEVLDRVFEPYYTTKEVGKGTGMGLSVVHGIVKRHGGGIRVKSEPGKGTLFELYFPAQKRAAGAKEETPEEIRGGSERILMVDDDEAIVKLNHQRLTRLGYRVKSTQEPLKALEWFRAAPDGFDVVITDMTMPKMTGDKLTKEILSIRPQLPVILCTGYSERVPAKDAEALGAAKYLEKPMELRHLASAIREVLKAHH